MQSWNFNPKVKHHSVMDLKDFNHRLSTMDIPTLAHGNGRSYGDVCLNEHGALLRTRRLNHLIAFDERTGRLVCESGVLLKDILDVFVPKGWFLPVVPGTQFVTVGGAVANDVHGKNHHTQGSFGNHVLALELLRSDDNSVLCSASDNSDMFRATIGGLGLTGLIKWVELQLIPIQSPYMNTLTQRFNNLEQYWEMMQQAHWPYNVAWIDCLAKGKQLGRGILTSAEHTVTPVRKPSRKEKNRNFPCTPPFSLVNQPTLKAFNSLYFYRPQAKHMTSQYYEPYFFPLDSIKNWNRMYGKKGFYQYQCVIPRSHEKEGIKALLETISGHRLGSFLAVLKSFSDIPSVGMLSFPREGTTLALDFPNNGSKTTQLFEALDRIVMQAGGAIYPAKDAHMSIELFERSYSSFKPFQAFMDPNFSSSFWRRVTR